MVAKHVPPSSYIETAMVMGRKDVAPQRQVA